jgi:MFS family permease
MRELSRAKRWTLLVALYFAQGIPFGLFTQALPVILRQNDTPLEIIGLSSALAFPWLLKWLWSPWVDAVAPWGGGRRSGWLGPLLVVSALVLVGISFVDPWSQIELLLVGIVLINFMNATQDIATDGLAVDILPRDERGVGNGIQVGGYRLGMLFGGALVLVLIETIGWQLGLIACAGAVVLSAAPLVFLRGVDEGAATEGIEGSDTGQPGLKVLWSFVLRRETALFALFVVAYKFGDGMAAGMVRPMLVDQGLSMGDIGTINGGVGFTAALVGTAAGGLIASLLSRASALAVGVTFQAVGAIIYVLIFEGFDSHTAIAAIVATENLMGAVATVVLFTCMMDLARPAHGGADYTVLASLVVMVQGAGSVPSGFSAANFGYAIHHYLAAGLALAGGAFSVWIWRRYLQPAGPAVKDEP